MSLRQHPQKRRQPTPTDSRAIGANPDRPGVALPVGRPAAVPVVQAARRTGLLRVRVGRLEQVHLRVQADLQVVAHLRVVLLVVLRVAAAALRGVAPDPRSERRRQASCCRGLSSAIKPITRLWQRSSFR